MFVQIHLRSLAGLLALVEEEAGPRAGDTQRAPRGLGEVAWPGRAQREPRPPRARLEGACKASLKLRGEFAAVFMSDVSQRPRSYVGSHDLQPEE